MRDLSADPTGAAGPPHDELLGVIRMVRRRWRLKLVLRGLAITAFALLAGVLTATYGMDHFRFAPAAVAVFRVLAYAVPLGLLAWFVVRPLLRRAPDDHVALYLEEHEPALAGQVMTAVDTTRAGGDAAAAGYSRALVERLVERAVEECARIDFGRRVDAPALARYGGALGAAALAGLVVLLVSPAFLRHGAPFLLSPLAGSESLSPYAIDVEPGDTLVPRGADLKVAARLVNFQAERVEIAARRDTAGEWERTPMVLDEESGAYAILLFDMESPAHYFVEAGGVRSPVFRVAVGDLPYVRQIDLEYHFPAHTGLAPLREEDGGDIAALAGTRVRLTVTPTVPVAGGVLLLDGRDTLALETATDGTLAGTLAIQRPGSYRILLRAAEGPMVAASSDYAIDVLADRPPTIQFTKPGRDIQVTRVEEVFAEVTANDDYGVGRVELVYAVNGGPERAVELHAGGRPLRTVTSSHTFYLEELELRPGDVIAYYARAAESGRGAQAQSGTTDIYFVQVRPFDRTFRQADQGMGGQGDGMPAGELSQRQREIIAATFNLVRDSSLYSEKEYRENLATLALAQGRLREEVQTLVTRMVSRGVADMDSTFRLVADELPKAVDAMGQAEEELGRRVPRTALPPEQRALQHLQRAEAAFRERQIVRAEASSGGSPNTNAEELADLFELELDRMRNQYERLDRGRARQTDEQLDETLERLQELARRQQQEIERMRAQAQSGDPTGAVGTGQRRLAEEAEEMARRLERLARDQQRPELNESARRLQEAADAMRRAATSQDGSAQGTSALDRLREARRLLEENRSAGLRREAEQALRRAERLAGQQRDVMDEVARLPQEPRPRAETARRLGDRKEQMAAEVSDLESQLGRLAREGRAEQPEAARKLEDAAGVIRRNRIQDKIRYSRGLIQDRSEEYARNFEEQIAADLEELRQRVADAVTSIGETREQRLSQSLDRTRDVANALESLGERLRERQQEAERQQAREQAREQARRLQPGQPGQTGEPGREQSPSGQPAGEQQGSEQGGQQQGQQGQQQGAPGAYGDARPGGPWQPGLRDPRQLRRELAERAAELDRLRAEFRREGIDISRLDEIVDRLGRMDNLGPLGTPRGIAELQGEIIRGLREFEFSVRRQLGGGPERLVRGGSDRVPPEYRELVDEYFKALAGERERR
ncbi:MAG: DUF4175 family protein [Gemmatimonadetes bacterium]|nr:DUF4175 family protein [Gemmatimonadota bacterium]